MYELYRPDGVSDKIRHCQKLAKEADPNRQGDNDEVNKICQDAWDLSASISSSPYLKSRKFGWYDITHPLADPFPKQYITGFLNQGWVQKQLGVPLNFSASSNAVAKAFRSTADMPRTGMLDDIGYLLDHGVKVAMVYGDRDYACNWVSHHSSIQASEVGR